MWGEPLNPEHTPDVNNQYLPVSTHWSALEGRIENDPGRLSDDRMAEIIDTDCFVSPEHAYRFINQYRDFLRTTHRSYVPYFIEKNVIYGDETAISYKITKALTDEERSIAFSQMSIREWRRDNCYTIIERLNDVRLTSDEQEEYDRHQEETDDDEDEDEEYRDECD